MANPLFNELNGPQSMPGQFAESAYVFNEEKCPYTGTIFSKPARRG